MKEIFQQIHSLAKPYLDTRSNDIHTNISINFAFKLLKEEGGDENIVIPGILLHDVGWKTVPEELQLTAFGPRATSVELNRKHELEGRNIAKEILETVKYDKHKIEEILEIIDGHDSRLKPLSLNDEIVKDADKLWRYSKEGFYIDRDRFGQTFQEGIDMISSHIEEWFFTDTAKEFAREEIKNRLEEQM